MSYLIDPYNLNLNPLRGKISPTTAIGGSEALLKCSATVSMIADLFGGEKNSAGYEMLATPKARYGLWNQLISVAEMLEYLADQPITNLDEAMLFIKDEEKEELKSIAKTNNGVLGSILRRSGIQNLETDQGDSED